MPYAEVGYVKNATKDMILNVDVQGNNTKLILYATGKQPKVRVLVKDVSDKILFDNTVNISPAEPFCVEFSSNGVLAENMITDISR